MVKKKIILKEVLRTTLNPMPTEALVYSMI